MALVAPVEEPSTASPAAIKVVLRSIWAVYFLSLNSSDGITGFGGATAAWPASVLLDELHACALLTMPIPSFG